MTFAFTNQFQAYDRRTNSGLAVMAIRNGETLFQQVHGFADVTRERPITADSLFDLASVAKPFTALAIAHLEACGLLDVAAPLTEVLDDLPDSYSQIRVSHLIHQLGGLPDYHDALCEGVAGHPGKHVSF